jgi:hypothetical protein
MAVFPPYAPDERSYDLGSYPVVRQDGWAGGTVRFRTGATRTQRELILTFRFLIAAAANQIRNHYRGQYSGTVPFQLGSITYDSSLYWVYAEPPEEVHRSGGLIDVAVRLRSVR